jgi:hemoglobin/transferrin/lactoferrin receptor protein
MLLFASLFSFIICKTDSSEGKLKLLDEVQVTASRMLGSQQNAAFSIESKNHKSLVNSNIRTTPEALMGVTGVFVQKTNHGGGSAFVRGLTGNQALIMVDGIRLNNSTFRYGPNQYLNTVDPYSLQKIEVLKGSGSVQYGSDAMGGVVHTLTENPTFGSGLHAKLLTKYTPNMEKTLRPSLAFGAKNVAVNASANWRNFGDLIAGQGIGKQSPSGYNEASYNLKTLVNLNNRSLTFAHQNLAACNVPIYHKVLLENYKISEFGDQKRKLSYVKLEQKTDKPIFENINITASLQNTYETRVNQKNNSNTSTTETDEVQVLGLSSTFTSKFSEYYKANSGIEIYADGVQSEKDTTNTVSQITGSNQRGLYPNQSKYTNLSAFSLHEISLKKWQFTTGLRYNYFLIKIPTDAIGTTTLKPQALVANFAVLKPIGSFTNIYASYNSGFRAPNIDDLGTLGLVDFRYELPNYNLKPETSRNWELGLKYQSDYFAMNTAVFYNKLKNLITRVKLAGEFRDGNQVYIKENSENAYIKGAELNANSQVSKYFSVSAGVCYLYGQNTSKNEPLRRIPPLNGRVDATFLKGKFFLKPEFLFAVAQHRLAQGDIDDNRIGSAGTAAWQLINIHSGYNFKLLKINVLVHNITNKAYKTHGSGVYGMGRAVSVSMEVSL